MAYWLLNGLSPALDLSVLSAYFAATSENEAKFELVSVPETYERDEIATRQQDLPTGAFLVEGRLKGLKRDV